MRYEKFAPMTSALLARKGEAAPSLVAGQRVPREIEPGTGRGRVAAPKKAKGPEQSEKKPQSGKKTSPKRRAKRGALGSEGTANRRIVLTLTNEEFERVEIAAAKRRVTRQQLARNALFVYLSAIALEHGDKPGHTAAAKRERN